MEEIYVKSSQALNDKITQLTQYNAQLQAKIDDLCQLEANANKAWDGEANDEFHNVFMQDKALFDEFHSTINQYIEALKQILQNYENAEGGVKKIVETRSSSGGFVGGGNGGGGGSSWQ